MPSSGVQTCADRKSTRLNSSHLVISYAVFCLKKKAHVQIALGPWKGSTGRQPSGRHDIQESFISATKQMTLQDCSCYFLNDTGSTEISTLSLHGALPI